MIKIENKILELKAELEKEISLLKIQESNYKNDRIKEYEEFENDFIKDCAYNLIEAIEEFEDNIRYIRKPAKSGIFKLNKNTGKFYLEFEDGTTGEDFSNIELLLGEKWKIFKELKIDRLSEKEKEDLLKIKVRKR